MSGQGGNAPPAEEQPIPTTITFLNAGVSGMIATCLIHPLDVVKYQMQMQSDKTSIPQLVAIMYRMGGITKFYSGLTAGLARQASYTTVRLGIYNQLQEYWKTRYEGPPSFAILVVMAASAGSSGAFFGTPTEVALVRMTTDSRLPPKQRRNYKNVIDAFRRIAKEEGVKSLWKGSVATMGRAVVVNVSQLATYSQAKMTLASNLNMTESLTLHFYASMVSGFLTCFNSMPFDIAKTRIQNMKSSEKNPGMFTVIFSIVKVGGFRALWKGFWPSYCKIGPHTVITFIVNEQITNLYRRNFMK